MPPTKRLGSRRALKTRTGVVSLVASLLIAYVAPVAMDALSPRSASASTVVSGPTMLGTLGGTTSYAEYVNNAGEVAGLSTTTDDAETHAFVWTQAGGMLDLGTLGGTVSQPAAINASGEIAGVSTTASGAKDAFVWTQADGTVDIGSLGGEDTEVVAINASGDVAGYGQLPNNAYHAFFWSPAGGMVDIGTLGGVAATSQAEDMNDAGQIVGASQLSPGSLNHAFIWTQAGGMVDLGTMGSSDSGASAINASGEVVGTVSNNNPNTESAFEWNPTTGMVDLGIDGDAEADRINDAGQVIGLRITGGTFVEWAWTPSGGLIDLAPHAQGFPPAQNNAGMVIGRTTLPGFPSRKGRGFLWAEPGGVNDIGGPAGFSTAPGAINDSGLIVGYVDTSTTPPQQTPIAAVWQFVSSTDTTAPTAMLTPANSTSYLEGAVVTVGYSCADEPGGSGLASCVGSVPNGSTPDTSAAALGSHTLSVTATDHAGNTATTSATYQVVASTDASGTVAAGDSFGTGTTVTPSAPIQTNVTSPNAGTVDIVQSVVTQPAPAGYGYLGYEADITAPTATATDPLLLQFSLDQSLLAAAGVDVNTVQLFRDGVPIAACADPVVVVAAPDPCIFARGTNADGSAAIYVYTSHASHWNFGKPVASAPPVAISTASVPNGRVGVAYSKALAATGGAPPLRWSVSAGALPAGLALNASTGVISGTPTAAGSSVHFTVKASDSTIPVAKFVMKAFTVTIAATADPSSAKVGVPYWTNVAAFKGVAPYHWSIASGTLPGGLALNATTGAISGTPRAEGKFNVTVQVVDSKAKKPDKATTKLSIAVAPIAISVNPATLTSAKKGVTYTATLSATGGAPSYKFNVTSGKLPGGLTLGSGGVLSGKATAKGTSHFTVTVTDKFGFTSARAYTLAVT
jgi:probable HAF family extracellular repeat protein